MTEPVADATSEVPAERYVLRQQLTLMVNRYEIVRADDSGKELGLLCFAEQKRMAAKEQVTFYTDAAKQHPLFGFKARRRLDLGSSYDVTDSQGQPIGWFKKHFKASLVTSTWTLGLPDGRELIGQRAQRQGRRRAPALGGRPGRRRHPRALPLPLRLRRPRRVGRAQLDEEGRHQGRLPRDAPGARRRQADRLARRHGDGRRARRPAVALRRCPGAPPAPDRLGPSLGTPPSPIQRRENHH